MDPEQTWGRLSHSLLERTRVLAKSRKPLTKETCQLTVEDSAANLKLSISVFSVVYFRIDVARGEQTIANTPFERPKTKFPLSMRLPDPADGDIHY
jgi:hypothetical protein